MNGSVNKLVQWCLGPLVLATAVGITAGSAPFSTGSDLPQIRGEFQLDGEHWTYQETGKIVRGILVQPPGQGPFPAVIVSHGLGGSAASFGLAKAREFARWGMVAIAPDYTHSATEMARQRRPGGPAAEGFGASPENLRRARICLAFLRRMSNVAPARIFAYGHSMGGFVTIALAAHEPLAAAAITASGIAPRAGFAAPDVEIASHIRVPFLMVHGGRDTTVRPEQSETLARILARNGVAHRRILIPDAAHDVDRTHAEEVFAAIRQWFELHDTIRSPSCRTAESNAGN